MRDELGDRMKKNYENRTRILLPRRTYTIIRVDGKAFHTYTKGCKRPFDAELITDMDSTAKYLCSKIQGAKIGFVQSDEISILMTDFDKLDTDAWFDGNIQKIVSIAASHAASKFNQLRMLRYSQNRFNEDGENRLSLETQIGLMSWLVELRNVPLADFDARTFTIPSLTEVCNYFIWRQQDTVRNSISSVAQSLYSSKQLHGKNMSEQQDMIHEKGENWNDFDPTVKRGRFIYRKEIPHQTTVRGKNEITMRNKWVAEECPTFTQDQDFLLGFIPNTNDY